METEENWDDLPPVPSYDPQAYAANAQVLRNLQGQPKSVKRQFRSNERLRLMSLNRNNGSNNKKEPDGDSTAT